MINRVLIRMKAVQLLYSYLLVEKPFTLESQPGAPTKEKRFAYNLYLDMLMLLYRLSKQVKGKNKSLPLSQTRFILRIENEDIIKSLVNKYSEEPFPFSSLEPELADKIKTSLLFKDFEKNKDGGFPTDNIWENIYNAIIIADPAVNDIIKSMTGYTLSGVDRMKEMMSTTFKNFYSSKDNISDVLNSLEMSMQKARNLYMRLLSLPVELTALRLEQLERNQKKLFAGVEDLNPNMKFVNNKIPALIASNPEFTEYVEENHLSWRDEDPELVAILLQQILSSEVYEEYLSTTENDLKNDSDFWQKILVDVIFESQDFLEYLENKSIFWNDDLEVMGSFVIKTLKRLEKPDPENRAVLPMYKDGPHGQDARFGVQLVNYVINNKDIYRKYIDEALQHEKWDASRMAFMDLVITMTAMAEIINFPEIPLAVSVNEYIEIAKSYSSEKSGQFIHGLLATIIRQLGVNK